MITFNIELFNIFIEMFEVSLLVVKGRSVDSDGRLHSIDDQPASDEYSEFYLWYSHGDVHRDNDKPACIRKTDKYDQKWVKHDYIHRADDKPAIVDEVESLYYFEGILHRLAGPARIVWEKPVEPEHRDPNTSKIRYAQYALYGAIIPEDTYNFFLECIAEQGCPPWVAWFYVCEIFEEEDIISLKEAFSDWKIHLPTSWVFNLYNLTDKTIKNAYSECGHYADVKKFNKHLLNNRGLDEILINLINAEPNQKKNPPPEIKLTGKDVLMQVPH